MAWTTPKTWIEGEVVTANDFNTELRDRFNLIEAHDHSLNGIGDHNLGGTTGIQTLRMRQFDNGAETDSNIPSTPPTNAIAIFQDNGVLKAIYDDGTIRTITTSPHGSTHNADGNDSLEADGIASRATLRSLGSGAQQAAAGNHGHELTTGKWACDGDVEFQESGNTHINDGISVNRADPGGSFPATFAGDFSAGS